MAKKGKMNLKSKKKKKFKLRYFIYMSIIYVAFSYTFYNSIKNNQNISNEEFINLIVASGNANVLKKYKTPNLVNKTMQFIFNIDITKPTTILNTSILKYGTSTEKTQTSEIALEYNDDYSDMEELKKVSQYIEDPKPTEEENPIVYLYNTHQLENYSNQDLDIYGITPNVLMASYLLREKLNALGINTIVEEANMSKILEQNNWNYSYSYQASRQKITEKKNKYSSLKYFIDIHRDSVGKSISQTTINNKSYAKILFVIGKEHQNWTANNEFATKLNQLLEKNYPGISRGIITKSGVNVNGIYNQDISPNCILIETGGPENNIEEVNNTMDAIADTLNKYMKGEKE